MKKNKINANIELGGVLTTVSYEVEDRSQLIEIIWNTYGVSTPILEIWEELNNDGDSE